MATGARSLRGLAPAFVLTALGALVVAGLLPWRCPLLALTGIPCPTCGITRAVRLALHGDFAGATRMHPLWFVVAAACAGVGVGEMGAYRRGGAWGGVIERRWVKWALGVVGVALMVVWIARFAGALGGPVVEG